MDGDDIFLRCDRCNRAFYLMLFTEDEDGFPNPTCCPWCTSPHLIELDDEIDFVARPQLTLLKGGLEAADTPTPDTHL